MSIGGSPKLKLVVTELLNENAELKRLLKENSRLQADRLLLASIVETSDDAIISKTLEGVILSWNRSAEVMFGYSAAEAIGKHISMLFPADRMKEEDEIIARLKSGNKIAHYETVRLRKGGREVLVSLAVSPIYDESGEMTGASKVVRDLTEFKRSAATARALQNELAHVGRLSAMGQMSAAIAHELNQPLAAINNYLSAAGRILESDVPSAKNLSIARGAIKKAAGQALRAGNVIRHLRDYMDKHESLLSLENLSDLILEAVSLALLGHERTNIKVNLALDKEIPPALLDKVQIQQVMLNLIRNAAEAMVNTPNPELTITSALDAASVKVSVKDNGPGFAHEIAGRLFQPFVTSKKDGMGIGLRICQSIVEAHGGTIEAVDGNPGAIFVISLPWNQTEKGVA